MEVKRVAGRCCERPLVPAVYGWCDRRSRRTWRTNPGARGRRRPLPGRAAGRLRLPARPALPLAGGRTRAGDVRPGRRRPHRDGDPPRHPGPPLHRLDPPVRRRQRPHGATRRIHAAGARRRAADLFRGNGGSLLSVAAPRSADPRPPRGSIRGRMPEGVIVSRSGESDDSTVCRNTGRRTRGRRGTERAYTRKLRTAMHIGAPQ